MKHTLKALAIAASVMAGEAAAEARLGAYDSVGPWHITVGDFDGTLACSAIILNGDDAIFSLTMNANGYIIVMGVHADVDEPFESDVQLKIGEASHWLRDATITPRANGMARVVGVLRTDADFDNLLQNIARADTLWARNTAGPSLFTVWSMVQSGPAMARLVDCEIEVVDDRLDNKEDNQ